MTKETRARRELTKCDCYVEEIRREPRYDERTGNFDHMEERIATICNGTKERDECSCGGDRTRCTFTDISGTEQSKNVSNGREIMNNYTRLYTKEGD